MKLSEHLPLNDGAKIGIIGGGPAGSLFAHFALRYARDAGLGIDISIFDSKSFSTTGARGCNMCAGVIARTFADRLKEEGIELPPNVVQRQVDGYWLETPVGSLYLHYELEPGGILTVYRGNGPRGSSYRGNISFDDYLLDRAKKEGVNVIPYYATDIELPADPSNRARVFYGRSSDVASEEFDLVVGAFGMNSKMAGRVKGMGFGYSPPECVRCIQAEVFLGAEHIQEVFGNSIYVYALRLPGVKFAAVTPKYDYLTVTVVGENVSEKDINVLLSHPLVRRRLPGELQLQSAHCRCQPRVAVSPSKHPYSDRLVMVGDASNSRLYKNGLESSFITAKAAAATAIRRGVSSQAFEEGYYPTCRAIARDSLYGKIIFAVDGQILAHDFSTRVLLNSARIEQQECAPGEQKMHELIWSILTGNRPYELILKDGLSPRLHTRTAWQTLKSLWRRLPTGRNRAHRCSKGR